MTFTAPLGLLALLAVPAVLALHLFRNRLPQRRVAALFLFPVQALQAGAGRNRTRLLRTPSFWCELLAATLLGLWLGGLSFGGASARPLVVVLDDSASMGATGTRERAFARLREHLAARGDAPFVGILRSGPRPEILLDPRSPEPDVEKALARWRPALPRHDVGLALDLARELAGSDGDVVFVTDEGAPPDHDDVTVFACGVRAPNAALLGLERVAGAAGDELHLRAAAYGAVAATTVTLVAGERELASAPVPFGADGRAELVLPWPAAATELRAQLTADALAIDDAAWWLPAPAPVVAVADTLPPSLRTELALDRVLAAVPGWRAVDDRADAQLILATAPGAVAAGQTEVVIRPGAGARIGYRGPFVLDRAVPWVDGLQLAGVVWAAGDGELPGRALVAAGPRVLASAEPLDAGARLHVLLDGGQGNVVRSPDWPVLFANLVDGCRSDVAGAVDVAVPIGGEARFQRSGRAAAPDAELTLVDPDGGRRTAAPGRTAGFVLECAGVHRWLGRGDVELGRVAAAFADASESDLRLVLDAVRPGVPSEGVGRAAAIRDTAHERTVLGALVLLLVVLDWWWLRRRDA